VGKFLARRADELLERQQSIRKGNPFCKAFCRNLRKGERQWIDQAGVSMDIDTKSQLSSVCLVQLAAFLLHQPTLDAGRDRAGAATRPRDG
jgi:hypothetical protein